MAKAKPLPTITAIDATRFWFYVKRGDPDECWPWQLSIGQGYGRFQVAGRGVRAHRVAYYLQYGVDPGEYLVCHKCDNPPCCNGKHLFLGTEADNSADRNNKGRNNPPAGWRSGRYTYPERTARGEGVGGSKLTADQVRDIRALYAAGNQTHQQLADTFGVTREAVSLIARGKNWKHVADADGFAAISDPKRRGKPGEKNIHAKLTEQQVREIRRLIKAGIHRVDLALQFDVSIHTIHAIRYGQIWTHVTD
jgi:HNH endonuclease